MLQCRHALSAPNDFMASGRCSREYQASNAARFAGSVTVARTTKQAVGMGFLPWFLYICSAEMPRQLTRKRHIAMMISVCAPPSRRFPHADPPMHDHGLCAPDGLGPALKRGKP